jgi:hypothetical protein
LCFLWCCMFYILRYWQCTPCFGNSHPLFTQHRCLLMLLKCWLLHPCSHNSEIWL